MHLVVPNALIVSIHYGLYKLNWHERKELGKKYCICDWNKPTPNPIGYFKESPECFFDTRHEATAHATEILLIRKGFGSLLKK